MAKKLEFKWQVVLCCVLASIFLVTFFVLWLTKVLSLVAFLILFILILLLASGTLTYIILMRKEELKKIALKKKLELEERERRIKELYDILGIEIQYDENGSVKDIFKLLNIEPVYDKDGNRVLTVYELIGFNPRFDENGKEVPNVFIIKNRVKKVARSIAEAPSFTYKPKPKAEQQQKEEKPEEKKAEGKPDKKPVVKAKAKSGAVQTNLKVSGKGKSAKGGKVISAGKSSKVGDEKATKVNVPKIEKEKKPEKTENEKPVPPKKPESVVKPAQVGNNSVINIAGSFGPVKNPVTKTRLVVLQTASFSLRVRNELNIRVTETKIGILQTVIEEERER